MRSVGPTPLALALLLLLAALSPLGAGPASGTASGTTSRTASAAAAPKAVVERLVIGTSVRGRDIVAYHLGEPDLPRVRTVVLLATMHGDEPAPRQILRSLVGGRRVVGLDLWVVPTYNPDGLAAGTRQNARGVDLNRNFPYRWTDLDGRYESGPRPASEPETKAVMGFLDEVDPSAVLGFHQPLHGVDTDTKNPRLARRVARGLDLPRRTFDCGGTCHGTMTGWFNDTHSGAALTVEYGASPPRRLMRRTAPDQVLSVFGAFRGRVGADPYPES